eukprot:4703492-Pyramimonas_sp.AAC.1
MLSVLPSDKRQQPAYVSLTMRGLLPPTPLGLPPGGSKTLKPSRRSACPIAWRGRATSRNAYVGSRMSWTRQ